MINLTDNFNLNKPAHLDARVGPWESVEVAKANVPFDKREIGLTLVVDDGSGAVEYWFKEGLTNADLVVKTTGGGGVAWGGITGTLSNQSDLNTALTTIQTDITTIDSSIASINANAVFDGDTAGGDLSGTFPNPSVHRVHGIDFQSGNPSAGDVWVYGGSPNKWQHQPLTDNEIPSGIDATKIANGNVSNAEFQTLDGVSSSIQTQLNGKEPTIATGTSSQFFKGNKTWATIDATDVPNLDASKITTGTLANQRMAKISRPMILQSSPSNAGNTTSEVVLQTLTIPANTLAVGDVFRICGLLTYTTTGTKQPRVRFGNSASGTPIIFQQASISASVTSNQFEFLAVVTNSTTLRFPLNSIAGLIGFGNNTGALQTASIDLTQPISISITIQKTTGTDTTTLETSWIEILTQ